MWVITCIVRNFPKERGSELGNGSSDISVSLSSKANSLSFSNICYSLSAPFLMSTSIALVKYCSIDFAYLLNSSVVSLSSDGAGDVVSPLVGNNLDARNDNLFQ